MLTIFSIPKPFQGHIAIIQENAIASWVRLRPACEIVLCGDETGIAEVAARFKVKHLPDIARNEYGTPFLDSAFDLASRAATFPLMCYVNTDIILLNEFVEAVRRVRFRRFLMVGQRYDLDLTSLWNYEQPDWEERLRSHVADHGVLHPPMGSDYFIFPKGDAIGKLPAFAVGRPAWDNWLIYHARQLRVPVIDATKAVTVIHQNHGYGHVPEQTDDGWEGPEADWNRQLIGSEDQIFTLLDATRIMTPNMILPALGYEHLQRHWQTLPILSPGTGPVVRVVDRLGSFIDRVGSRFRSYFAA
jgi:hypothetical protein